MGLQQLNFAGLNKIEVAIARLKEFEPPKGYYLAFSGGKDSIVLYDLALKSGVKFDAHYSQGGIDQPELVYFIRKNYPDVLTDKPKMTVWEGIQVHGLPGRQVRWCCRLIKEQGGIGRTVLTGIRWAESAKRAKRGMYEVCHANKTKKYLHPIIDFTTQEIWLYIKINNLPYCSLYDEKGADGKLLFKRLGCVLCPMESPKTTQIELKRQPKLCEAWHRAAIRYYNSHVITRPKLLRWSSGEDMWQWWLTRKGEPKVNNAQCFMLDN